ncbi:hypothetical protein LguiA_029738 [Lonicera macranthoides]
MTWGTKLSWFQSSSRTVGSLLFFTILYFPIYVSFFTGALIGCAFKGNVVTTRAQENSRFYGSRSLIASDILLGSLPRPPVAAMFYCALSDLY